MSSISGIFYRNGGSVTFEEIKGVNDSLNYRGPDGSKIWFEGPVAFGHQMLHTTPESLNEILPFEDETSGLVITSDARIDNRAELAPILNLENTIDIPDSLFILRAYQKWGEKCPEKLLGDFAFAIWDKENEKMFCARDHMGVKPFYYYLSDDFFIFATEIKAIFKIPNISKILNELKVAFYLTRIDDRKSTFYKNICRLPAAHSLTINLNEVKKERYWQINQESKIKFDNEEDYIREFQRIFDEAVNCRLRSAFPLGFELSGGLDSSSVVCTAKKILKNNEHSPDTNIDTFSIVFNDFQDSKELYYINEVVSSGGINPHFLYGDKISPLEGMDKFLLHLAEPVSLVTTALHWELYNKMRNNNIRIFLTGQDGDTTISKGDYYFKELAVTFHWKKLIKEIYYSSKVLNKNKFIYNKTDSAFIKNKYKSSVYDIFMKNVLIPLIPEFLKKLFRTFFSRSQSNLLILQSEFSKRTNMVKHLNDLFLNPLKDTNTPRKKHLFNINLFTHQQVLEYIDHTAAAFYMEPRFPFYDKRLIEFCYAIPTSMKYKHGWSRYILREAMKGTIPDEVKSRVYKQDFGPMFHRNFLLYEKNKLEKMVHDDNQVISDYVDLNVLNKLYDNYKSQGDGSGIADKVSAYTDIFAIWRVMILYSFLRNMNKN